MPIAIRRPRRSRRHLWAGCGYRRNTRTQRPRTADHLAFRGLFQASYEVDIFGRLHRAIEVANANADAVAAARDSVRVVVAAETTRAYASVCALGEELAAAHHSFDVVSRERDITVNRHDAGANSDFDVARSQALQLRCNPPLRRSRSTTRGAVRADRASRANARECAVRRGKLRYSAASGCPAARRGRRRAAQTPARRARGRAQACGGDGADRSRNRRPVSQNPIGGLYGGAATELSQLNTNIGAPGSRPLDQLELPEHAAPRARIRQAKAGQVAALAAFDAVVLNALKETEQALVAYVQLSTAGSAGRCSSQDPSAFGMTHEQFLAGAVSNLDLLATEQLLVSIDSSVASSDAALILDQIAVFKALGGAAPRKPGSALAG